MNFMAYFNAAVQPRFVSLPIEAEASLGFQVIATLAGANLHAGATYDSCLATVL